MLEWAGMLILISHHLTLKSPIHDCCTSSIMCSYTIPTVMDHPSANVAECSGNDTRRKTQSNPPEWAQNKKKQKNQTWISTLWFLQSIFLPSSLFLESFLKKGLSGSVTGHNPCTQRRNTFTIRVHERDKIFSWYTCKNGFIKKNENTPQEGALQNRQYLI